MNKLTPRVAMEVAAHEGLVREAYKDSVGVWTWSIGITSKSGHRVERYIDNPQTLERCLEVWLWVLQRYADDVTRAMGDLPEHQFAAALSFHYNTGAISSALWVRLWKAKRLREAEIAIMNWSTPAEIIPRRKKEQRLFFEEVWSGGGMVTEYEVSKPKYIPKWSSAKRVDVREAFEKVVAEAG